jgi:mono/diheme cytochrome c family protein
MRRWTGRSIMLAAALGATSALATSALAADADNGERLARRWCAACHVVASNQQTTTSEAPPFAAIARKPDFNAGALALFLLNPHPKMPDMGLSRSQAEDLAAYIAKQK